MARPSKTFLFGLLEKKLKKITKGAGIDAGSADFKNRELFKTDSYFGLDIDLSLIREGLKKYPTNNTFGILADMTDLGRLPEDSAEVVVSTNALYKIDGQPRIKAVANLGKLVSPEGYLLCQLPRDEFFAQALKIARSQFRKVHPVYYKSIFSRAYESIFEKEGALGSHPFGGFKPLVAVVLFLSWLEHLTSFFPFLNENVFLICWQKKSANKKNAFALSRLPKIEERLYDASI